MKKELDEQLVKKYPKIFVNRRGDMRETAMCWGFECLDGWYDIIDNLCRVIQNHVDNKQRNYHFNVDFNKMIDSVNAGDTEMFNARYAGYKEEYKQKILEDIRSGKFAKVSTEDGEFPHIVVQQIKEKYGTLRFYTNYTDDYINGAVSMAECISSVTCEECGKPGKLYTSGWWRVACQDHKPDDDLDD